MAAVLNLQPQTVNGLLQLDLSNKGLPSIPPEVFSMFDLEFLNVSNNKLNAIPEEVGRLQKLYRLDIGNNMLSSLPKTVYSLIDLEVLNLSYNKLSSLPPGLEKLQKLTKLYVYGNQLTEVPPGICSLSNLEVLNVGPNPIRRLPDDITRLTKLKTLDIVSCQFDEFPIHVLQLKTLERLYAGQAMGTKFHVLPDEIGNLAHLQYLSLDYNLLRTLPGTMSHLRNLREIHLDNNEFETFPEVLCTLPAMEVLDISNNDIIRLPTSLSRAKKLNELAVSGNPLSYPPLDVCNQGTGDIVEFLKQEEVREEELQKVFSVLTGMILDPQLQRRIARFLGLSESDIKSIQEEFPDDVMYQVLGRWREKEGTQATVGRLTSHLKDLGLHGVSGSISRINKPRCNSCVSHQTEQSNITISLPTICESQLEMRDLISHGEFAVVEKAYHRDWGLNVAVKRLTQQVKEVEERQRLYHEVQKIAVASTSPHIVDIRGICMEFDFSVVMTYMDNGSLKELLTEKEIFVTSALRWRMAHEISLGLNFLHCQDPPIFHGDMKAANVLLDKEFHAKVAEFGLAKWRTASRQVKSVSQGSDVYSFGITLWEILSRKEPQEHVQHIQLAALVREGEQPVDGFLPEDSEDVEDMARLMCECWAGDPLSRPHIKDCCSTLAKGCAKYTDYDMLNAVIGIKKGKENTIEPKVGETVQEIQSSPDSR